MNVSVKHLGLCISTGCNIGIRSNQSNKKSGGLDLEFSVVKVIHFHGQSTDDENAHANIGVLARQMRWCSVVHKPRFLLMRVVHLLRARLNDVEDRLSLRGLLHFTKHLAFLQDKIGVLKIRPTYSALPLAGKKYKHRSKCGVLPQELEDFHKWRSANLGSFPTFRFQCILVHIHVPSSPDDANRAGLHTIKT
ncbi:hypothetical protein NQ318_013381 [Aromia moschata]|uniref:Uncharacterized protein n=1 Tax=Aromia moschata TaxID=1265417 RepID=A0AAV8X741_9CUCU|nr:hypothetical protein NQ318_013381 [Aromia moschata]